MSAFGFRKQQETVDNQNLQSNSKENFDSKQPKKEVNFKNNNENNKTLNKTQTKDNTEDTDTEYYSIEKTNDSKIQIEKTKVLTNINKSTLKRPHTSLAVLNKPFKEEKLNADSVNRFDSKKPDPVQDDRYLSLLNSMSSMYKPTDEINKDPFKRIDNMIKKNRALYGRIEAENEKVKDFKISNQNLKLFEQLISRTW